MERQRLADIEHLVRDVDGFDGVYLVGERPFVVIGYDLGRARAAARLTALSGIELNIVSSARRGVRVTFSSEELVAAAERDATRRAEWERYELRIEDGAHRNAQGRVLLLVSADPDIHAATLRAHASGPLRTLGTSEPSKVMEALAVYAFPQVVVLDSSLPGTDSLDETIRALYPSRFGRFGRVQWMSSKTGLRDIDVDRILRAIGLRSVPALARQQKLARLRILIVDAHDSTLASEVEAAAPGAKIEQATGWEAIDRLGENDLDLVVAAHAEDISLPTLVRFVSRCANPPLLVIASDEPRSTRMKSSYPQLAHYFIARPVCTDDLLRVLRS